MDCCLLSWIKRNANVKRIIAKPNGMGCTHEQKWNEVIKWGLICMAKQMVSKSILSKPHNRQIK